MMLDDENIDLYVSLEANSEIADDTLKEEKKSQKNGLLNWLKLQKWDGGVGTSTSDKSSGVESVSTPSMPQAENGNFHTESRFANPLLTERSLSADLLSVVRPDRKVPQGNFLGQVTPSTNIKEVIRLIF